MNEIKVPVYWDGVLVGELTREGMRGLRDMLSAYLGETYGDLKRLREAIYPEVERQRCLLHKLVEDSVVVEDEDEDW